MPSSQITDLINPMRLRLGIKRAFTGDVSEILSELFQNSQRAGARNVKITTDERGFIYQDDGCGLRSESDFEALVKLGESGWDQLIEEEQHPIGLGIHSLLAHDEVESVTFSSHLIALSLDSRRWWVDEEYAANWRDYLRPIDFPAPGMNICVTCSSSLTEKLIKILTNEWQIHRSPARGYYDLLSITVNDAPVETSTPLESLPKIPLIETSYQNNRLVIGLTNEQGYGTNTGIVINWFGQLIAVDEYKHFQVYLEVRSGRPINPMSPSRRGVIKDDAWKQFGDFILNSFLGYFTQTPAAEVNPLALQLFFRDYPGPAASLPCFVAARRNCYESGGNVNKLSETSASEVFRYERQPLILADDVKVVGEDSEVISEAYGLHSFLELTGAAYKVIEGDKSRLAIRHLWWKPGERIELPADCLKIFHGSGQWGLGTEDEAPHEWCSVGNHIVFTFNDPSNWDVSDVDFIVGGAEPQDFYQTDAWAGFDPNNDEYRSLEEMSESYRVSCASEIRNIIGNAVPENFSWEDLLRFTPEGLQIAAVTPEYKSLRNRRPVNLLLILSNDDMLRLRIY